MTAVLLVEDDVPLRQALASELHACGYEVLVAGAVDEASAHLRQRLVDVLVTDLRMGGRDGIDLLGDVVRLSPRTRCVLMSAYATARDHQRATELGAVRVLCKPFTPDELRDAVGEAVECATGFRGSFHGLSLVDMLQMFHLSQRSLRLDVLGVNEGFVEFRGGELVHARYGDVVGEGALPYLLRAESGAVSTTVSRGEEQTICRPFQNLLLDVLCLLDEQARDNRMASSAPGPWRAPSSRPPAAEFPLDTLRLFSLPSPPIVPAVVATLAVVSAAGVPVAPAVVAAPAVPVAPAVVAAPAAAVVPAAPAVPSGLALPVAVDPPRALPREVLDAFVAALRADAKVERAVLVGADGIALCHAGEGGLLLADVAFVVGGLEALLDEHASLGPAEYHVVQKGRATVYVVCHAGRSCAFVLQGQVAPARAADEVRRLLKGLDERDERGERDESRGLDEHSRLVARDGSRGVAS
ncbi:MAG: response regulator [Polyangiaceae bacterium]|nr:response regulator [Polyangiaceae bacterium]